MLIRPNNGGGFMEIFMQQSQVMLLWLDQALAASISVPNVNLKVL
jgi:hypothetical protein